MEEDELDEGRESYYDSTVAAQLVDTMVLATKFMLCFTTLILVRAVVLKQLFYLLLPIPASRAGLGFFQAVVLTSIWCLIMAVLWWRLWRALENPVRRVVGRIASSVARDAREGW